MAASPEDSRAPSALETPVDIEKTDPNEVKLQTEGAGEFKRPVSNLTWVFVCVGLYLGAILYGMCYVYSLMLAPLTRPTQASTLL